MTRANTLLVVVPFDRIPVEFDLYNESVIPVFQDDIGAHEGQEAKVITASSGVVPTDLRSMDKEVFLFLLQEVEHELLEELPHLGIVCAEVVESYQAFFLIDNEINHDELAYP